MEDEGLSGKGKIAQMIKSVVISYVLTAVILLVFSFILYRCKISVSGANGGILLTYVLSCFAGGFIFSGSFAEKRYVGGGLFGVVYFLIVYCVSALWNHSIVIQMPGMLTAFLICVFAGMLGGMLRAGFRN